MCFSPEASFTGGILLISIGIATVRSIHKPSQILFAIIPLFFGLQQITEGFLWLSLRDTEYIFLQIFTTKMFLIMAEVFWPIMIPLTVLLMEENGKKRKVLWGLILVGAFVSGYYAFCIFSFNINPQIIQYHIQYNNDFPKTFAAVAFAAYLTATIIPLFVSSIKKMRFFGILMLLSCIITAIFFTQYLTSVWCFFAALISGLIYWMLRDSKRKFKLHTLFLKKKAY